MMGWPSGAEPIHRHGPALLPPWDGVEGVLGGVTHSACPQGMGLTEQLARR